MNQALYRWRQNPDPLFNGSHPRFEEALNLLRTPGRRNVRNPMAQIYRMRSPMGQALCPVI